MDKKIKWMEAEIKVHRFIIGELIFLLTRHLGVDNAGRLLEKIMELEEPTDG